MKKFSWQMPIMSIMFATAAFSPLSAQSQAPPVRNSSPYQFTKIGVKHYDAGVIADLMTRPNGIIVVPPNFVVPANAAPSATAPAAAPNVLPEGVRRIFVLESDNSVVIEATPDGLASLSR